MDTLRVRDTKPTRPTIHLSSMTHADIPAMARIFILAFHPSVYRPALNPSRSEMTAAEALSRDCILEERRFRRGLVGTDVFMKASVSVKGNTGIEVETIVGWARWTPPAGFRRRSILEWIWSKILYPLHQFLFRPTISPGLPDAIKQMLKAQYEDTFGRGGRAEGRKTWYLHLLCVDPAWQGHGVGGALLEWGMERAKEMDAVVYLESSPHGLPMYVAKGFRVTSEQGRKINNIYVKLPGMIWEPRLVGQVKIGSRDYTGLGC